MRLLAFAAGAATPVGLDATGNQAEMAAGTQRFYQTEVLDPNGESVIASRLSLVADEASRTERMAFLAREAAQPALWWARELGVDELPVLLALPEEGGAPYDFKSLQRALVAASGGQPRLGFQREWLFPAGRAGFAEALKMAARELEQQPERSCLLVGGVDSAAAPESLRRLSFQQRLACASFDGVIPGEGAAFVLIARDGHPFAQALPSPLAEAALRVVAVACADEPRPWQAGEPSWAEGLTSLFKTLSEEEALGNRSVQQVLACHSGERFFYREFGAAMIRYSDFLPPLSSHEVLAEQFGDQGAGAGAVALIRAAGLLAEEASSMSEAQGPKRVLVYGSSDSGRLGGYVVEALPPVLAAAGARTGGRAPDEGEAGLPLGRRGGLEERFNCDLWEEHLEELGFFVHDRELDLFEQQVLWRTVADTEARMRRHLAALCHGGEACREFALRQFGGDNEDRELGAVRLLVDRRTPEREVEAVLERFIELPPSKQALWVRALRLADHEAWASLLRNALGRGSPEAVRVAVELMGHGRQGDAEWLAGLVADSARELALREAAARSLALLAPVRAPAVLLQLAAECPGSLAAAWSLLTVGHPQGLELVVEALAGKPPGPPGMLLLLAQAGEASHAPLVRAGLTHEASRTEATVALGTLGLPEDVPVLLTLLEDAEESVRKAAVEALQGITGAIFSPVPAPEAPEDEQDGVEEESAVVAARWQAYWEPRRRSYVPGRRLRRGVPFSLEVCLAELEGRYPYCVRRRVLDELRFRWKRPVELEPDWLVERQVRALATLASELEPWPSETGAGHECL